MGHADRYPIKEGTHTALDRSKTYRLIMSREEEQELQKRYPNKSANEIRMIWLGFNPMALTNDDLIWLLDEEHRQMVAAGIVPPGGLDIVALSRRAQQTIASGEKRENN